MTMALFGFCSLLPSSLSLSVSLSLRLLLLSAFLLHSSLVPAEAVAEKVGVLVSRSGRLWRNVGAIIIRQHEAAMAVAASSSFPLAGAASSSMALLPLGVGLAPPKGLYSYEPLCPSTCGLDRAVGYYIQPGFGDPSVNYLDIGTAAECAALCAPSWNYYQWSGPGSQTLLAYRCQCFLGCHSVKIGNEYTDANFLGVAPLCSHVATQVPSCPSLEVSPNGILGVPIDDPSVLASVKGSLPAPLSCRDFCLVNAPSATTYQWAGSDTFGGSFTYGDCLCLAYCPSSRFTSFSPMTFYLGSICASVPTPGACAFSALPDVLSPIPGNSGITCTTGTTSVVQAGTSKVVGTKYNCKLCNPPGAPGDIVDYVASVSNFVPVSTSGITPAGLIPGIVNPKCCLSFSYTNPFALGPADFKTFQDPYYSSTLTVLPPSFGTFGTPASAFQLALGPCSLTSTTCNSWGTLFSYSCQFTNTSPQQIRSISLACPNFNPFSLSGIHADCTITKVLAPGAVCVFGFQTVGPYSGPLTVTGYTAF